MAKEAKVKTNAMRILDAAKVPYEMHFYENKDGKIDGLAVAAKIGESVDNVYKTLVTMGHSKELYVYVIPVDKELNLKKAAKAVGEKSVEMIHVKDINKFTGYIRGGCSPIGMKKLYKTVVNDTAKTRPYIIVSGGKIGTQIKIDPQKLIEVTKAEFEDIIM